MTARSPQDARTAPPAPIHPSATPRAVTGAYRPDPMDVLRNRRRMHRSGWGR